MPLSVSPDFEVVAGVLASFPSTRTLKREVSCSIVEVLVNYSFFPWSRSGKLYPNLRLTTLMVLPVPASPWHSFSFAKQNGSASVFGFAICH